MRTGKTRPAGIARIKKCSDSNKPELVVWRGRADRAPKKKWSRIVHGFVSFNFYQLRSLPRAFVSTALTTCWGKLIVLPIALWSDQAPYFYGSENCCARCFSVRTYLWNSQWQCIRTGRRNVLGSWRWVWMLRRTRAH